MATITAPDEIFDSIDELNLKVGRLEQRIKDVSHVDVIDDLPTGLGPDDAGRMWRNDADGKAYIWTGTEFIAFRDTATQIISVDLAASSVTADKLAAGSVTATAISAGSITTDKLDVGAVTADKIAANSITTAHLQANAVTAAKIAANTITAGQIAADTITAAEIAASAITTSELAAGAVIAAKITAGTITATEIAANTITGAKIAATTITASNIVSGTITGTQVAATTITAANIAANTITATQIAAATITATQIASATITGGLIAASTITATNIATGTITGSLIAGATITGSNIVSGSITSTQISVSQLDAVSSNMGTLTTGKILIGAAGGAKIAVGTGISTSTGSKDGIIGTDSSNVITFWIDPVTGNLSLKGTILSGSTGLGNISGSIDGGSQINTASITNDRLVANTITAAKIAAGTITATEIAAVTITAGKIVSGTITATQIAIGTITADRMNVTDLSAITANFTSLTSGTITAATVRSSSSAARVVLDTSGVYTTNDSGATKDVSITAGSGLVLNVLNDGSSATSRDLEFITNSGADVVGKLRGLYSVAAGSSLLLVSSAGPAQVVSDVIISAQGTTSASDGDARLEIRHDAATGTGLKILAHIFSSTRSDTVKILDNTGVSDFAFTNNAALTGTPTAPTAVAGTSTTQLATTAFVATADNLKANLASPTFTGTPAAPTAVVDTNTTQVATTAFVIGQAASATPLVDGVAAVGVSLRYARQDHVHPIDTSRAAVASPTFTGTPAAPTASAGDNSTQLATTAFVNSEIGRAGSAFPTTGLYDGLIFKLQVPTSGGALRNVVWTFRYSSVGGTYKWEFVGGPPYVAEDLSAFSTSSTSFSNINPSVTLPVPGIFACHISAQLGDHGLSMYGPGVAASDDYMLYSAGNMQGSSGPFFLNFTSSGTVGTAARSISGASTSSQRRRISIIPVKCA